MDRRRSYTISKQSTSNDRRIRWSAFADGKVNGKLTVSENIADAGGLSCALEAAKTESDLSIEEFFVNWATIWRTKAKKNTNNFYCKSMSMPLLNSEQTCNQKP
ncbi:M13-type metalloendopeptidase [Enterococcus faecium]